MPFIPHTDADVAEMLAAIGVPDVESLFDEIPSALRSGEFTTVGDGLPEMEVLRRLGERARRDETGACFLGAGSYDHHVPAAVWDIAGRGEFMTAYTPYQAEASQGTLQLIYEFQTMMSELTGMDVCNASVYDGGSGLAEAVLMAVRANRRGARGDGSRVVAIAGNAHPLYVAATRTIVRNQGIEIVTLPHGEDGRVFRFVRQSADSRFDHITVDSQGLRRALAHEQFRQRRTDRDGSCASERSVGDLADPFSGQSRCQT